MSIANNVALPISSAYCGSCCINCCELPSADEKDQQTIPPLKRCTACRLACYCSRECQAEDWKKNHKVECKVLKIFKERYSDIPFPANERQGKSVAFLMELPSLGLAGSNKLLEERFTKFVMSSRACSICNCNEFDDADAKINGVVDWQCCPNCKFGWCCSLQHWEEYKHRYHTQEICNQYQRTTKIQSFHYQHIKKNQNEMFLHMAQKSMTTRFQVFPNTWEEYFRNREKGFYPDMLPRLPSEFYPAATKLLSQPVTCLYAMYKFGISHFDKMKDLTIHVVGTSSYEVPATCIWEEITHCLPNVQCLTIQFIGPEACHMIVPVTNDYPTESVYSVCPECTAQGRQRRVGMFGYTYHDYVDKYLSQTTTTTTTNSNSNDSDKKSSTTTTTTTTTSSNHKVPNFIVAFNTGMYDEYTESWTTSLQRILDMNIPAYFTSYNESEAIQDRDLLRRQNANIIVQQQQQQQQQDAGQHQQQQQQQSASVVERNPFSEDMMDIEPRNVRNNDSGGHPDNFFCNNMYGVLVQGRKKTS